MPSILSSSHCEFNGACSCTHARKTILLAPIHPFTKQMVPLLCPELLTRSLSKSFSSFSYAPYKVVPFINNILRMHRFFLCLFLLLSFSSHIFSWACGSLREPWKYFQTIHFFVHSLLCQITHSFLNGF